MNIIFISHPAFMDSLSMPRYINWVAKGMEARGHQYKVVTAKPFAWKLSARPGLRKWLGYIDQFLIFPSQLKKLNRKAAPDTLFVFADNALGPWVPAVADRPHVVHCHDFLAQNSALGLIPENPTSATGKQYQAFIRRGLKKGKNFISISENTQRELHNILGFTPAVSRVVYNGLTSIYKPSDDVVALRKDLSGETGIPLQQGYLMHVGGNQWYKNRKGIVRLYDAWRKMSKLTTPLIFVGQRPDAALLALAGNSAYKNDIHFLTGKDDVFVKRAYMAASVFLFPSIAEGFGWPTVEAMASGVPVITTASAPMTEVGGDAALYIDKIPFDDSKLAEWCRKSALVLEWSLNMNPEERRDCIQRGLQNVKRFDPDAALDAIAGVYQHVLTNSNKQK